MLVRTSYSVLTTGNEPFLRIFMSEVTPGHEIESEARSYFGMGSFLVNQVTRLTPFRFKFELWSFVSLDLD